jgi:hypothetical protein
MNDRIMFLRKSYYVSPQTHTVVAGNPVGCVAIRLHKNKRSAEYQISVLNPLDRFDRAMARQLALGRLAEAPITVRLSVGAPATMEEVTRTVMLNISVDTHAASRARKAAKLWLKWNS